MGLSSEAFRRLLHEEPDLFRASVNATAARTGFSERLIEKDYFCSLILRHFSRQAVSALIFKGGTSLSKVFLEFSRLSEDLDFMLPCAVDATKSDRSSLAAAIKPAVNSIPGAIPFFRIDEPLRGANASRQYLASIGYQSLVDGAPEVIRIEVGLREPVLREPVHAQVRTALHDAGTEREALPPFDFLCLSLEEAMAEKFRAALSREEVAGRDFYDIDIAAAKGLIDLTADPFIELVRQKLSIPGNKPPDTSDDRVRLLRAQMQTHLKPVLRTQDFAAFDLDRPIALVRAVHDRLRDQ
jgi:predicted nucleotidyltransferase component of viral defense system